MKANSQEEIIDLSDLLSSADLARPSTSLSATGSQENKPSARVSVPAAPPPLSLHQDFQHLLDELHHLLRYLELIETGIMQEGELEKTLLLFRLIHDRSLILIPRMDRLAARVEVNEENMRLALEATSFALRHEVRRVYEVEAVGLNRQENINFSRSDLMRAFGLLQNCFQQSAISLTQAFNSSADAEAMFEDHKIRKEQSLVLHRELTLLMQKAYRLEKESGILQILNFINSLERFRHEIMQYLMYRDWEEFESFIDQIVRTYDERGHLDQVLHQFICYLETLQKHVSMRAVLNSKFAGLTQIPT